MLTRLKGVLSLPRIKIHADLLHGDMLDLCLTINTIKIL